MKAKAIRPPNLILTAFVDFYRTFIVPSDIFDKMYRLGFRKRTNP